jgi:hypothetical protein
MAGIDGNMVADGLDDHPFHLCAAGQAFQGPEDHRVVGDDQVAVVGQGLLQHGRGAVQRHQHAGNFLFGIAGLQARIIVAFLKREGGELFQTGRYFFYFCHFVGAL